VSGGSGFPVEFQGHRSGEIPFIKVSDMNLPGNEKYIVQANHYVERQIAAKIKSKPFSEGALIFPKVGAALLTNKRRLLSRTTCIDNNLMAVVSSKVEAEFLYYWSLTVDMGAIVQTGALPSINQSTVENLEIPIPEQEDQQNSVRCLRAIDQHCSALGLLQSKLLSQKHGLMQQLLTGTTRVKGAV